MASLTFPIDLFIPERSFWPLSLILLQRTLEDRISDRFLVRLVWERLGYLPSEDFLGVWCPSQWTPIDWKEHFPYAPEVIVQRRASVHLTRSIPQQYKQLLKEQLNFKGYKIGQLFPRRTRRATVVCWLLAWAASRGEKLAKQGPSPSLLPIPTNPVLGHPGDPSLE